MKLLNLFVRYGDKDYKGAFQRLCKLYSEISELDVDSIIIDTSLPQETKVNLGLRCFLIGGDNERREFSGWRTAIEAFSNELHTYDLVNLVTSALENHYNGFYELLNSEMLDYAARNPEVVLAHIDAYPHEVRLLGRSFQTWACSKFILVSPKMLTAVGSIVPSFNGTDFFLNSVKSPFKFAAPLSANYRQFLLDWLTGDGLPHGKWHSVFDLSEANLEHFQFKALSIIDEHYFSIRLREVGAQIIDFDWLSCQERRPIDFIPDEITQILERNIHLFNDQIIEPTLDLRDYPNERTMDRMFENIHSVNNNVFSCTPLIEALVQGSPFSQKCDLDKQIDVAAIHIYFGMTISDEQALWLYEPMEDVEQDSAIPITRGIYALYQCRKDLKTSFDIRLKDGRQDLISWWMTVGIHRKDSSKLVPNKAYTGIADAIEQDAAKPITKGCYALYLARSDLQDAYNIETKAGRDELSNWWLTDGIHELKLDHNVTESSPDLNLKRTCQSKGHYRSGGVNLIGFGRGELGIGEDVRMAARALMTQNIDYCVPDIGLRSFSRESDLSLLNYEVPSPLYRSNLIFLPHYEMLRLVAASRNIIMGNRYNIACWQWELPQFPAGLELTLDLVDEIWSSSQFTANAIKSATEQPVFLMPMAVTLPDSPKCFTHEQFGIPEDCFTFLCIFDGNSRIVRKNPAAVIRAFQLAFPIETRVHLFIKTMNMTDGPHWQEIFDLIHNDKRITIRNEMMNRSSVIGLQSLCDCFVSLHRAEGFGRNIAEAMLLGKPVIVSNFSGNTDFTTDKTAFLVNGDTIPVNSEDYHFARGQFWFDPDISCAAEKMSICFDDPKERSIRISAGKEFISRNYSPEVVGKKYMERLIYLEKFI